MRIEGCADLEELEGTARVFSFEWRIGGDLASWRTGHAR